MFSSGGLRRRDWACAVGHYRRNCTTLTSAAGCVTRYTDMSSVLRTTGSRFSILRGTIVMSDDGRRQHISTRSAGPATSPCTDERPAPATTPPSQVEHTPFRHEYGTL